MSTGSTSGPRKVRVIGAGVAGLAAASLLARGGADVTLIDDALAVPRVGTSLALFGRAQRTLNRLGVLEDVRRESTAPRTGAVISADGRTLARIPAGGALLVSRSHLVSTLLDALPDSVVRERRRVLDVRPEKTSADVLVGADGVHSLVRRSGWGPRSAARIHGRTVLRGTADIPAPEVSETWGAGWLFGITPLPGNGTNWFAAIPEHRTAGIALDLAHLRSVVGGARPPIDTVLDAAFAENTLVHGIATTLAVCPVRENVVLIGDAAHAMAPNLGHGANTALNDAAALADELCSDRPVGAALRGYTVRRHAADQAWRLASSLMLAMATTARGTRASTTGLDLNHLESQAAPGVGAASVALVSATPVRPA